SFTESDSLREELSSESEVQDTTIVPEEESILSVPEKQEKTETNNMSNNPENNFFPQPESPGEQSKKTHFSFRMRNLSGKKAISFKRTAS
ncbi:MAG TPA: hypothetical protein PLW71_00535, partial [Candidatus Syntrophosphaera thermopropionivorans]|nr:hypothetical protein [Candidatus Syntrophosphaera thermopropionivorans]